LRRRERRANRDNTSDKKTEKNNDIKWNSNKASKKQ
jgi:hypothetical protein